MEKNIEINKYNETAKKTEKKSYSIFAMFLSRKNAREAIKELKRRGYAESDISLIKPDKHSKHDFVYKQRTNIKTGVLIGGLAGFIVFGTIGFVIGLYDPFQFGINSKLYYTLGGIILGIIFGLAGGALIGIGVPKSAAKRYGFYLKEGAIVVKLHLKNQEEGVEANTILSNEGGQDIVTLEESQVWSTMLPEKERLTYH